MLLGRQSRGHLIFWRIPEGEFTLRRELWDEARYSLNKARTSKGNNTLFLLSLERAAMYHIPRHEEFYTDHRSEEY